MDRLLCALLSSLVASALFAGHPDPAAAAPPVLPEQLSYQALLLDDLGAPRTGSVDLEVRIFDALTGGTLVYTQLFTAVPLSDGVFTIQLGPTGEASDSPDDPLTTDLGEALAGDLTATAPDRFMEVTVGSESPLTRTQVLSVPYSLRADSAATADAAADTASVGGLPAAFVTELFEHGNHDGDPPGNDDPSEGLGDTDGDGIANFIDDDNDDDGITDANEFSAGSDLNLVTPTLSSHDPDPADAFEVTAFEFFGTNFDAGMSATLGSEAVAPTNITATRFEVDLGPDVLGTETLEVVLPNGETATRSVSFIAAITSIPHSGSLLPETQASLDIKTGGLVLMGVQNGYRTNVEGSGTLSTFFFPSHESLDGATPGQGAFRFTPAGDRAGVRCRTTTSTSCAIELTVDTDADSELADESNTAIETLSDPGNVRLLSPSLRFSAAGAPAVGYVKLEGSISTAVVAHDRDGNGDFLGTNERVDIEGAAALTNSGELAIDSAGRVAYAYARDAGGGSFDVRLAHDLSGDGDFDDVVGGNPELFTVETVTIGSGSTLCVGLGFDASDRLVLGYSDDRTPRLRIDASGDGDFSDVGEDIPLQAPVADDCAVLGEPESASFAYTGGNEDHILVDRNGDGDFDDATEKVDLSGAQGTSEGPIEIGVNPDTGAIVILRGDYLIAEPGSS